MAAVETPPKLAQAIGQTLALNRMPPTADTGGAEHGPSERAI